MAAESVLIVGGGPAGLEAARLLADIGTPVTLVEKRAELGGMPIAERYAALTHGFRDAESMINNMVGAVSASPLVDVRLGASVVEAEGEAEAHGAAVRDALPLALLAAVPPPPPTDSGTAMVARPISTTPFQTSSKRASGSPSAARAASTPPTDAAQPRRLSASPVCSSEMPIDMEVPSSRTRSSRAGVPKTRTCSHSIG